MILKELEKKEREDMFSTLRNAENSLNKQLAKSEEIAEKANIYKKTCLLGEYDKVLIKNQLHMEQVNREKEKARNDMLAFQRKYKDDLVKERERQKSAHENYQKALNEQLEASRNRSLNSLKETMTEKERKFNLDMLHRLMIVDH